MMIGNTVKLKGGRGPEMTVIAVSEEAREEGSVRIIKVTHYNLFWFDVEGRPYEVRLPVEAVEVL